MNKIKKAVFAVITSCVLLMAVCPAYAITYQELDSSLTAEAAIIAEVETGKILYKKNENEKMYPASITKVLTALVALDYLSPGEMLICGNEVNSVPNDSSKAGHVSGEAIIMENAIRGLIIPSGNETACVVAKAVAQKAQPNVTMTYDQAEKFFCNLMNQKAKDLGALNSNFVNPHGYHNSEHYSTAYDLMLIAKEAMKKPLIKEIAAEKQFVGNGAGENPDPSLKTKVYEWKTRNELIAMGEYNYPYANGIKTGHTFDAGFCVASSAEKDGINLVAIALKAPDEAGRWNSSKSMFEYGYENYGYREVQAADTDMGKVLFSNSRLGESNEMEIIARGEFTAYLSQEELNGITKEFEFYEEFLTPPEEEEKQKDENDEEEIDKTNLLTEKTFIAPIEAGTAIGTVTYMLNGEILYADDLIAEKDMLERTFKSDMSYHFNNFKKNFFTLKTLLIAVGVIVVIIIVIFIIRIINRRNRRRSVYTFRKRY